MNSQDDESVMHFMQHIGKTIVKVDGLELESEHVYIFFDDKTEISFTTGEDNGHVRLIDIDGDVNDLIGGTVLSIREVTNPEIEPDYKEEYDTLSLWTYYFIETTKGFVSMRWLGESNGHYSVSVYVSED